MTPYCGMGTGMELPIGCHVAPTLHWHASDLLIGLFALGAAVYLWARLRARP